MKTCEVLDLPRSGKVVYVYSEIVMSCRMIALS